MMPHFEDVAIIPNPGERAEAMRQLINRLPTANRLLLQYMFKHMGHIIARRSDPGRHFDNPPLNHHTAALSHNPATTATESVWRVLGRDQPPASSLFSHLQAFPRWTLLRDVMNNNSLQHLPHLRASLLVICPVDPGRGGREEEEVKMKTRNKWLCRYEGMTLQRVTCTARARARPTASLGPSARPKAPSMASCRA
ncbi:uncharacterized protein LOC126991052 isoform X1 [Eriocheir sinensis]|uniref:uncharacterized protein LOC126991052 isoform X1 n=1 Tax=Eriocheir sinensis TaxID=95602 RepID=UPI0021CA25C8|nr:uncharacterized protein LOC126991052 isoform X1 [Eriocheir sinensis]XP_050705701.1 uncharacterized protein LOC126991052 isoform X1 [Eriocheir sinensis]XP_050705702.1 uncharacterized protein LOC126991052 isoform X1 [Eriocheir sinensis]XP_050705703.1 uncharacterized protein LOC126991052 isoform X1 [Eriocheir sinensis]XP_050705704.1 uncharacterized protein LOC126991052 isoform X1 [Eriocheir sinensis]XP_050705705.1 uncharacterized protein LOC126991052 isoform X1 [Eriocheir sinensis]